MADALMPRFERIIFFGTPGFSVPTLDALEGAGQTPVLVVAQPSRRSGRGRVSVIDPPVAAWAKQRGVPLVQPARVTEARFLDQVREQAPDLAVVVAFGQIFPPVLLDIPVHGCMNLHASLLPKYRGAAPIQAALMAGERTTGVTTMLMEAGLDSGPILLQSSLEVGSEEMLTELSDRLASLGGRLVVDTLTRWEEKRLELRQQDDKEVTYAPRLRKEDGRVDWTLSAQALFDRWRALTPWPGLWTTFRGETLKILRVKPSHSTGEEKLVGTLVHIGDGNLEVQCGDGSLLDLQVIQRPGRKPLMATQFANGEQPRPGEIFD